MQVEMVKKDGSEWMYESPRVMGWVAKSLSVEDLAKMHCSDPAFEGFERGNIYADVTEEQWDRSLRDAEPLENEIIATFYPDGTIERNA